MFDCDYEAPKPQKVPTLSQYLQKLPKKTKALQQIFGVEIIWTPGTFDNVTLQTHAFRLILPGTHKLYTEILENVADDEMRSKLPAFGVFITDRESRSFELRPQPSKAGRWVQLSDNGFKFSQN